MTVIGEVPTGRMVQRATASVGDAIYVSGTLGNAALGLRLHTDARAGRHVIADAWGLSGAAREALLSAYLYPQPRLSLRHVVREFAAAAMDVSDGFVKDLERMCLASGVAAVVQCDAVPLSPEARSVLACDPDLFASIASAGDDYEILAVVPSGRASDFEAAARQVASPVHCIGSIVNGTGVVVTRSDGSTVTFHRKGWDHF